MPAQDRPTTAHLSIAQFGTFDVENYGDLLFPLLAQRRLEPWARLQSVSPIGGAPVWHDALASINCSQFAEQTARYHGILVGGGNIIRVMPTDLFTYDSGVTAFLAYSDLWLGVAFADVKGPICWNAPGLSQSLPPELHPLIARALDRVDYISVRDEPSLHFLREVAPDISVSVTPDPAWELDRLWTQTALGSAYENAFTSRNAAVPGRSIAIHLNSRYFRKDTPETVAAILDSLSRRLDAKPLLIACGPCHGDSNLARLTAEQMKSNPLIIDQPASLLEVAACIARSVVYVGSSMHGFITASSFCVPAVIIANPTITKFTGLVQQIGLPDLLHQSWADGADHASALVHSDQPSVLRRVRESQQVGLDEHWSKITEVFQRQDTKRDHDRMPAASYREAMFITAAREGQRFRSATKLQRQTTEHQTLAQRNRLIEKMSALSKKLATQKETISALNKELATEQEKVVALNKKLAIEQYDTSIFNMLLNGPHEARSSVTAENRALRAVQRYYSVVKQRKDAALLAEIAVSGFFDPNYYLRRNADVANAGLDPLIHFVEIGAAELRNPSPFFDTKYYVTTNFDVLPPGSNSLVHYLRVGRLWNRLPRDPTRPPDAKKSQ